MGCCDVLRAHACDVSLVACTLLLGFFISRLTTPNSEQTVFDVGGIARNMDL